MNVTRVRLPKVAMAIVVGAVVAAGTAGSAALAVADNSHGVLTSVHQKLTGYAEDPLVVSTSGTAEIRLKINDKAQEITYTLSYTALAGTVTQSHIHFGGRSQSGGIAVFLCSNLGNGPAGTQLCPAGPATITGTITAANVIGPAAQGIAPGEFTELLSAIRAGATYANIHSSLFPAGEIRAQLVD